ncbi:MAG TPA: OmpH family outer membrane protein [Bryobacteraceae bacterium]|jgi:outer membrane protein
MSRKLGLGPLAVCSALFFFSQIAPAQSKVAIINLQKAVLDSAEIQAASAAMTAKFQPRANQIEQLQREIQGISDNLQRNAGKLTPQAESDLNAQGQRKQRDLQRLQEDLQADVDRERNDILGKSTQKMTEVVKKIAEEKGYDLVVDVSNTVYFKPAMEITTDVIAAYNKAYPAAAPAPAPPKK